MLAALSNIVEGKKVMEEATAQGCATLKERVEACAQRTMAFQKREGLTPWTRDHFEGGGLCVTECDEVYITKGFNALFRLKIETEAGHSWPYFVGSNQWKDGIAKPYAGVVVVPVVPHDGGGVELLSRFQMRIGIGKPVLNFAQGFASDTYENVSQRLIRELEGEFGTGDIFEIGAGHECSDHLDREILFAMALMSGIGAKDLDPGQSVEMERIVLQSPEDATRWLLRRDIGSLTRQAFASVVDSVKFFL